MNFIVERRNEYTIQLVNILSPLLYEGFDSIYKDTIALKSNNQTNKILKTFQQFIKKIPSWNENIITMETNRILSQSRCEWLLDLIKAVIKSNIILLSSNNVHEDFKVDSSYLDINLSNFIHNCYIECARQFYNMPYLFSRNFKPIDRKKNQKECLSIIDLCIREAIRKNLPVHNILKQYLGMEVPQTEDNQISENDNSEEYKSGIKNKLSAFINPNVVDNFRDSDDSSSSSLIEDCDDKETANLIKDLKDKLYSGNLIENAEVKVDKFIHNIANNPSVSEGLLNYSYEKNNSLPNEEEKNNSLLNEEIYKSKISETKASVSSGTPIRFSERERQIQGGSEENKMSNNEVIEEVNKSNDLAEKINEALSQIEEDNDEINNSISYKIDHDSEYEAVFSNLNDNYDATNKKKRKDEYFSKFNNI